MANIPDQVTRRRHPTVKDVAAAAGVSASTVSNVLHDHPNVTGDKRDRVNEAIARIGYRPSFAGRQLRGGHANLLALAIPDIRSPYFADLAHIVMMEARLRDYTLFIDETGGSLEQERDIARGYPSRGITGIIFCPVSITIDELEELKSDIPTVLLGEYVSGGSFDHISIDSYQSAKDAADYLFGVGRRRVAFIGSRPRADSGPTRFRLDGLRAALADHGLTLSDELVVGTDAPTREEGYRAAMVLIEGGWPVDAIVCAADLLAVGVLAALRERGIAVPGEIAVMGWDDSPEAHFTSPPLTSVAHDMSDVAKQAILALERRRDQPGLQPESRVATHRLVIRESA